MKIATITLFFSLMIAQVCGFSMSMNDSSLSKFSATQITRRNSLAKAFGIATSTFIPNFVNAEVTEETERVVNRMGGLLEGYKDLPRGWSILAPAGWNKFDGEIGAYDTKWQDVVEPMENIKLSTNPVKSNTTSIAVLGDVKVLGDSLATKRDAKLLKAEERQTSGVLFYDFEFAIKGGTHQLLTICVSKGKVWSLDANSSEKRWPKRKALYENAVGSFLPKLS